MPRRVLLLQEQTTDHHLQATNGLAFFLPSLAGKIGQELMRKEHLPMDTLPSKGHQIVSDMAPAWVTKMGVTQPPECLGQMALLFLSCSGHFKNAWEKLLGEVQHPLLCPWSFPRGTSVGLVPPLSPPTRPSLYLSISLCIKIRPG